MKAQRWFRWLIRLLPLPYRDVAGDELVDALDASAPTGWTVVTESFALVGVARIAWLKFLRTPTGIRNAMFFGALSWFGFLIAHGPVGRVLASDRGLLAGFYDPSDRDQAIGAAALLVLSFVLMSRSRVLALAVGVVGVVVAALSIRVGEWQLGAALPYDFQWLGLPLVAAVVLKGPRRVRWLAVAAAALPGLFLAVGPFGQSNRSPGYGHALSRLNEQVGTQVLGLRSYQVEQVLSNDVVYFALLFGAILLALGPWVLPASAAVVLPAVAHLTLLSPTPATLAVVAYVAAVLWIRTIWLPDISALRIRVTVDRSSPKDL